MKKELTLVADNCALPIEDVIVVMKFTEEYYNQYSGKVEKNFNVQVMLDLQPTAINIVCKDEDEQNEMFEKLLGGNKQ